MIERQIARPIPIPFSLVVKKAWKALRILYSDSVISSLNKGGIGALRIDRIKSFFGRSGIGSGIDLI
jgi:hypothetical protein